MNTRDKRYIGSVDLYQIPDEQHETPQEPARIDGRSLRRTGRTIGFSTKVSPDFENRLKLYAAKHKLLIVEVLERALDALEKQG